MKEMVHSLQQGSESADDGDIKALQRRYHDWESKQYDDKWSLVSYPV